MVVDDFMNVINVNLLGVIAVTMSVLPLIKKAKGRIVNISSVLGRICFPSSPYCVSKFGVEAFNDCLRWVIIWHAKAFKKFISQYREPHFELST